jgi:carbon storage regulator
MLVLSRKLGERVLVPQCALSVTVVAIEGNTVRLGISAPAEIGVYREELWRQIRAQPAQPEALHSNSKGRE